MSSYGSNPLPSGHLALQPGFADPVLDSQRFFRAALEALSRPGTIVAAGSECSPGHPAALHPAAAGLCLTLLDASTPVWLDCAERECMRDVCGWLRFHSSCRIVDDPAEAAFALITAPMRMTSLDMFSLGTLRDPHLAATLFIQIQDFATADCPEAVTLSGPGVENTVRFAPHGIPDWFWDEVIAQRECYPQGVDIYFTFGSQMAGLPRSVRIQKRGRPVCT